MENPHEFARELGRIAGTVEALQESHKGLQKSQERIETKVDSVLAKQNRGEGSIATGWRAFTLLGVFSGGIGSVLTQLISMAKGH